MSLPLLLAHAGAIILGYAARDQLSVLTGWWVESLQLLRGGAPDMVTAFASMGVLLIVAVTSVRAARARVSHETWHVIHLAGYAAVALSVPHQLSVGSDIAGNWPARLFWIGLYLLTVGAVILFRVLLPAVRSARYRLRVEAVVSEGPGVVSLIMTGRNLQRLPIRSGQFLYWRFLAPGLWAAAHPWSISAAPDGRRLRLTVRDLGDHSRRLARVRPGTRALIEGPYGAFTTERRTRRRVLLIAAGIGITPIRALAEEFARDPRTAPGDVTVLYRAADRESLVFRDEWDWLVTKTPIRVEMLLGPSRVGSWLPCPDASDAPGRASTDASVLARLVPHVDAHDVYLCGPPAWLAWCESR